jgi:hypothetical protein
MVKPIKQNCSEFNVVAAKMTERQREAEVL